MFTRMREWLNAIVCLGAVLTVDVCSFHRSVAQESQNALPLILHARKRIAEKPAGERFHVQEDTVQWAPSNTAIIICDMWDDHYCRASAKRVAELAPAMNRVIQAARDKGVLIIHCPSGCMDKYEGTPQRELARKAPRFATQVPLLAWCYLDPKREPALPIVDSEPCDDEMPREKVRFYRRQHESLEIKDNDAITDSDEAYYLMKHQNIQHVIVMGVHTNMCVLGRPFGIRQLVAQGMDVVLMRDMTDCMYNPKQAPFVDHFAGLRLVIEHIEKHWCPTVTSADIVGGQPFRFQDDKLDSGLKH